MSSERASNDIGGLRQQPGPDLIFAVGILVIALIALAAGRPDGGLLVGAYGWPTATFFLLFGLFTITMGYPRPGLGHVSFDRVAQVACILVLGPWDAAWINGLASLIYPWHRVWHGVPVRTVLTASLHNAGMMSLVILTCGSLYTWLGGPVPLAALDLTVAGLLLLLGLCMQVMNDVLMACMLKLRKMTPSSVLSLFSMSIELASVPLAVLVAIVFVRLELSVFALFLACLGLGMTIFKLFAQIRNRLEALVEERTEALRIKSRELERQAPHDKLTGIYNRRFADDYLQREIEASQRYDREFTIAFADIDNFKTINDRYSHAVGDAVLRRVAQILVNRCRKTDVVARYGGEEFLLCFPDTNAAFAERICSQMRVAVEQADWSAVANDIQDETGVTMSFGVAELGEDLRRAAILSTADSRLYRAKSEGRNRVVA